MNVFNIRKAFEDKKARNWEKLYWLIDLHGVVLEGKYNKYNDGAKIYPGCREVFKWFSRRPDMIPILWTSSHLDAIDHVLPMLEKEGICFKCVNTNPEVTSDLLCDFSTKLYFNILLDDKAGFEGDRDWYNIIHELTEIKQWI